MSRVTARWSGGANFGILVHGGAGMSPDDPAADCASGCREAARRGFEVLVRGGNALDAVECAVRALEDDERYNAGRGATLTEDGTVELDAAIMNGKNLAAGAVCVLSGFSNPVLVARRVLEDGRHVLYAGAGAERFALATGFTRVDPSTLVTEAAREKLAKWLAARNESETSEPGSHTGIPESGGTVGAVARDAHGSVAAATSTGGTLGKRAGRVGDSPILGAGTYADDLGGAASATGNGEGILRVTLAARAVSEMRAGAAPDEAAASVLDEMFERVGAAGGLILADRNGRLGFARTTEAMAWAAAFDGGDAAGE